MSEMIERVAKALYIEMAMLSGERQLSWDKGASECQNASLILAAAAISAMRFPTEKMEDAGGAIEMVGGYDYAPLGSYAAQAWEAMIDEALK
jgi:hypothetical protein